MALIGNYSLLNRAPYRQFATGVSSGYYQTTIQGGVEKNRSYGGFSNKAATPNGYLHPMAWVLPIKPGSMSSYTNAQLTLNKVTAELYEGRNLEGSAALVFTLTNAQLDQIVALVASGVMELLQSNAGLSAAVGMDATASLIMDILSAQLGGIIPVSASSTLAVTPAVTMTALAGMEAEAGGPTPLSPEGLAQAVWNALIADYGDAGTTGKALADAGGAGNPWAALLASNQDPGSFGEHVQKLLKTTTYLGTK